MLADKAEYIAWFSAANIPLCSQAFPTPNIVARAIGRALPLTSGLMARLDHMPHRHLSRAFEGY